LAFWIGTSCTYIGRFPFHAVHRVGRLGACSARTVFFPSGGWRYSCILGLRIMLKLGVGCPGWFRSRYPYLPLGCRGFYGPSNKVFGLHILVSPGCIHVEMVDRGTMSRRWVVLRSWIVWQNRFQHTLGNGGESVGWVLSKCRAFRMDAGQTVCGIFL
jgi:hypothetical protein